MRTRRRPAVCSFLMVSTQLLASAACLPEDASEPTEVDGAAARSSGPGRDASLSDARGLTDAHGAASPTGGAEADAAMHADAEGPAAPAPDAAPPPDAAPMHCSRPFSEVGECPTRLSVPVRCGGGPSWDPNSKGWNSTVTLDIVPTCDAVRSPVWVNQVRVTLAGGSGVPGDRGIACMYHNASVPNGQASPVVSPGRYSLRNANPCYQGRKPTGVFLSSFVQGVGQGSVDYQQQMGGVEVLRTGRRTLEVSIEERGLLVGARMDPTSPGDFVTYRCSGSVSW